MRSLKESRPSQHQRLCRVVVHLLRLRTSARTKCSKISSTIAFRNADPSIQTYFKKLQKNRKDPAAVQKFMQELLATKGKVEPEIMRKRKVPGVCWRRCHQCRPRPMPSGAGEAGVVGGADRIGGSGAVGEVDGDVGGGQAWWLVGLWCGKGG